MKRPPLKVFFCYSHKDAQLRSRLDLHLDLLEREGLVTPWHDGRITPGLEWSDAIQENLRSSDLIVFLISNAFLESTYIAEVEMRLALELHRQKKARLVPVLVETIPNFEALPLGKLETLPTKALPISRWKDPVRALDDVVTGIRRAALSVIIEGGGPFEFRSHEFSAAELADLRPPVRAWTQAGLKRLRCHIVDALPPRSLEKNLLVATWSLQQLGRFPVLPESLYYMAQVLSSFDVVALQEVHWKLDALQDLLGILGPEWGYFVTDVKEGAAGNMERIAILHYRPRVAFEHVSGEIVLPDEALIEGRQFARKPLLSSFRAGSLAFRICSAHVYFGGGGAEARVRSVRECQALADYLVWTAKREHQTIILAGNFNMTRKDSDAIRAFKQRGFRIPPRILHPSSISGDKYYDMIGLYQAENREGHKLRIGASGSIDLFEHVFRSGDEDAYSDDMSPGLRESRRGYDRWKTRQLSDHRPVWLELRLSKR